MIGKQVARPLASKYARRLRQSRLVHPQYAPQLYSQRQQERTNSIKNHVLTSSTLSHHSRRSRKHIVGERLLACGHRG